VRERGRCSVVDLVFGSFGLALAPVGLVWAFKLLSGSAHWIALGLSRAF
jgi:hypothetical protein